MIKKLTLYIALLFTCNVTWAQNITSADFPALNETWFELVDSVGSNIAITTGGSNQVWNYSNNFTITDTNVLFFQSPALAPLAVSSLFPQASIMAANLLDSQLVFLKADTAGLYIDGFYTNHPILIANGLFNVLDYNPNMLFLPAPFQYLSSFQNVSKYEINYADSIPGFGNQQVKIIRTITQDFEGDASGQLITPAGQYNSVLRLKETTNAIDSIFFTADTAVFSQADFINDIAVPTSYKYSWVKNGPDCLVMTAEADENNNITTASYYNASGFDGINKININAIKVYPNPSTIGQNFTVQLHNNFTSLAIYNVAGAIIYQQNVKNMNTIELDNNLFLSGVYTLQLSNGNNLAHTKLVVVK